MNERIKELWEEAAKEHYGDTWEQQTAFMDKFAELIVRECCNQLIKQGEGWQQFAKNPPQGQENNASAALFAAYRLKEDAVAMLEEHFGVNKE